jgi:adenosine kinase
MNIIVTGSISYDYLMRFPGKFSDHLIADQLHQISLSFLVEEMTKHWGGVAANIAYSMALLGLKPKLMGTVGSDFADYRRWLDSAGVDTSTVRQIDDVFTASFFANTDLVNNQIASFYSGAMTYAKDYSLVDAFDGTPDLVIISPNDPTAMQNIAQECRERDIKFIYDPSQQVARLSGEELARDMKCASMMVVNAYEAEVICQKTGKSIEEIREEVGILVITQGERGSHLYKGDELIEVEPFPPNEIQDPTGVGDAFRAGLIYGIVNDWPLKTAAHAGALCAAYVLEQVGTQSHKFAIEEFVSRFRTQYNDDGLLDSMLK